MLIIRNNGFHFDIFIRIHNVFGLYSVGGTKLFLTVITRETGMLSTEGPLCLPNSQLIEPILSGDVTCSSWPADLYMLSVRDHTRV